MGVSIVHASIGSVPYTVELSDDLGHRWLTRVQAHASANP